jgi:hypothetical protein
VEGTDVLAFLLLATVGGTPVPHPASAEVETRRVEVSYSFAGRDLFLHGSAPVGTRRVLAVLQGPPSDSIRLMQKGRVALFWLGVRQYRLGRVPGLYLVNVSNPACNGFTPCRQDDVTGLEACDRLLPSDEPAVGPAGLFSRTRLSALSGPLQEGENARVLQEFWALQAKRGLYGVRLNGIRLNAAGAFYHSFRLPASAPEGRYQVTTYFLGDDQLLGTERNDLFVRKSGVVEWVSRLAERRPFAYGAFTVLIALAAGWLAGTLFGRGGH